MKNKKSKDGALGARIWGSIVIFGLFGQLAWVVENMYFNVYLFNEIGGTAGDIATMVAASAITAAATTLFVGVLSDKLRRRKVFITFGYIIWGVVTASFGFITVENTEKLFHTANAVSTAAALIIIMDCVMTFFGSTASDAAFNSWVTDVTNGQNRGRAEAIMQAMPLLAILIVFGLLDGYKQRGDWQTFFIVVGAATSAGGALGFFILKDRPKIGANTDSYFKNIFYGFRPSTVCANKELYITFAAFCILNIAYQVFMPYIIIYLELSLGITDYAVPLGVILILAAVISVACGRAIDRLGKVKFMFPSIIVLIGGFVFMYFATGDNLAALIIAGVIMMSAYLITSASLSATIRDYTPNGKVGLFQGIRMVFQVLLPMVIGPYIGAAVISNNSATYEELGSVKHLPTSAIFLACAAVAVLAVIPAGVLLSMQKKEKCAPTPSQLNS